jgi:hypothetical protein
MENVPLVPDPHRRLCLLALMAHATASLPACGESSNADPVSPPPPTPSLALTPSLMPTPSPTSPVQFPLRAKIGERYLVDAAGVPFLVHGDTAWSIVAQLKYAEIALYLDNRAQKGFNTILFSAPEAYYTSQTPPYLNTDGLAPFTPMIDFSRPNDAYWRRVDSVVNLSKARGILCIVNPAYLGYPGGRDGWAAAVQAASPAALHSYGAFLANRFTQGNVVWCMGGDRDGDPALIERQWNIISGIRSVRTTDVVTAHPLADTVNADDAWTYWGRYVDFRLNAIYGYEPNGFYVHRLASQAYSRHGPMPFIGFEFKYETSDGATPSMLRRQSYGSLLSGACGQIYGNNPVWHFASTRWSEPYSGTWQSNLDSQGAVEQQHVKALFAAYEWWKLAPKADLVTTELGAARGRLYPAVAGDGSFAMIYVPVRQRVSVALSMLTPERVRVRLYDPTRGTFDTASGSPLSTSDVATFTVPGERVVVLDAAA